MFTFLMLVQLWFLARLFAYIRLLREAGPDERLWGELKKLSDTCALISFHGWQLEAQFWVVQATFEHPVRDDVGLPSNLAREDGCCEAARAFPKFF